MNIKHILLGTAAGLMVATGAQAADLPGEAVPAAVDYVKVCDAFGAGFFYIPGGDTCFKIDGRVRVKGEYTDDSGDLVVDITGRVGFDARTATEYGTLRSYFRIGGGGEAADKDVSIEEAFIQLGYLTVGETGSIFDQDSGYGIYDLGFGNGDTAQLTVLYDGLGGGFYVGGAVEAGAEAYEATFGDAPNFVAVVGVTGQPWGSAELGVKYFADDELIAAKLGAIVKIADPLEINGVVYYAEEADDDQIDIGLGAKYSATDTLALVASLGYTIDETDVWTASAGVEYTVVPGLVAEAGFKYTDTEGADEDTAFAVQLTRSW
ncbi:porin [Chthonobacter albigriseus]|uniref:porin n=1 Tax=Chthonobacter albigriseus TaxID=1683161 RepID=UPI0015EF41C5|nr:porin [Chthonobacter albigriseus]